eukprot:7284691-Prymnesium_polylepis.1
MEPVVMPSHDPRSSVMLFPEMLTVPGIGPKEETAETVKVPFDREHCSDVDGAAVGDDGAGGGGAPEVGDEGGEGGGDDTDETG